nr:DEAD-box ATP-dependent RNA helicase 18 [Tanacetum cinerariifolium]
TRTYADYFTIIVSQVSGANLKRKSQSKAVLSEVQSRTMEFLKCSETHTEQLVLGVIISPTIELSSQVFHVAQPFILSLPDIKPVLLVGGTEVKSDMQKIEDEGANLLIGTPGRLHGIFGSPLSRISEDPHVMKVYKRM